MRKSFIRAYAAAPLVLIFAVAGCAGSDGGSKVASAGGTASPSAGTSGAAGGLSEQERALKFAQCMREHGVQMDDPTFENGQIRVQIKGGAPGVDLDAAQQACKEYAPSGPGGGKPDPQAMENMRKMAQCMRENGVPNFPDPEPGGGIKLDGSVGEDPDFEAAQKKCESQYMPGASKATS